MDHPLLMRAVSGDRQPRRFAAAGAIAFALIVIALVVMLFRANSARDAAEQAERRSYDILVVSAQFDSAVAHAEAALNAFVISGDRRIGTRYFDQWVKAGRLLNRLDNLSRFNPNETRILGELREAYEERGRQLARPATLATYERRWAAYGAVAADADGQQPTARRMRQLLDQLGTAERTRLVERREQARTITDWSNMLDALTGALAVLLGLAAVFVGWTAIRALAARADSERRAARDRGRAAELEAAVAARTAELTTANENLRVEAEERLAAEAQLAQIQKMDAVGQLSGGIAHDFNNMLAVVVGGLDLARRKLEADAEEIGRHIENAMDGANRAAGLTRRLLAFAHQQPLSPEGVSPNALIASMTELLDRTLGERITIVPRLANELWPVFSDPSQLENAILNLAVNARDAMPNGGRVTVDTANHHVATPVRLSHSDLQPGDYVTVRVGDSGCGMDAATLARVVEPFFTTKEVGKGTGLGLSQVFGFMKQSGGGIDIQSRPGVGTSVTLFLPRHTDTVALPPPTPAPAPIAVRATPSAATAVVQSQRVLVVEDDPRVRMSTVNTLTHLGYAVVEAENGHEALRVLASAEDIRLVLSDVIMPGMTGPELAERLRQIRPDIAVIFTTGYAGDAAADLVGAGPILHKPFTIAHLQRAVSDVFQHPRAAA